MACWEKAKAVFLSALVTRIECFHRLPHPEVGSSGDPCRMHAKKLFFLLFPRKWIMGWECGMRLSPSQMAGSICQLAHGSFPLSSSILTPPPHLLLLSLKHKRTDRQLSNIPRTLAIPLFCQSSSIRPLSSSNERASPSVNLRGANEDSHLTRERTNTNLAKLSPTHIHKYCTHNDT